MSKSRKDIVEFLIRVNKAGISVFVEDDKLKYTLAPNTVPDPFILNELKQIKEQVIDFLKSEKSDNGSNNDHAGIKPRDKNDPRPIPLSFAQERLWFIDKLEGSVHYHIPSVIKLKGKLNITLLELVIRKIIDRHEVLRTLIKEEQGQGYQEIIGPENWSLGKFKIPDLDKSRSLIYGSIHKPFDLSKDYKLRADLFVINDEEHVLVATFHHIASDGWSSNVMIREVIELYSALGTNKKPDLPLLEVQYADYALWQREHLQGELLSNKLDYWVKKLRNVSPLELPTDKLRPPSVSSRGASFSFVIDKKLSDALEKLNREKNATMFMTLLTVFKVLLHRYSGQQDICIGTPIAGRQSHEIEDLIGFFVNTLAIRSEVHDEHDFFQLLEQVKTNTLEAYDHQEVPFEKIVETLVRERDLSRSPIFQVMFAYQNTSEIPDLTMGDLRLEVEEVKADTSKFELAFYLHQWPDNIYVTVEYSTDLFQNSGILRLKDHYLNLLQSVVSNPYQKVGDLLMLDNNELSLIVGSFNRELSKPDSDINIVQLFEAQAISTPNATALVMDDRSFSYDELNKKANKIAHTLIEKGVSKDTPVPIIIERSPEMIMGVLGILKAGAAYVPVDTHYPDHRMNQILDDIKAKLVLCSRVSANKLAQRPELLILANADDLEDSVVYNSNLDLKYDPEDLAYILYTSGSTGVPKGVQMSIGSLTNLLQWQNKQFVNRQRRVLQYASLNFDVSFQEIFSTLCYGSTLYLISHERRMDLNEIYRDIKNYRLTHLFLPFALLKNIVNHILPLWDRSLALQEFIVAGEQLKLTEEIIDLLNKSNIRLINHYGPTEAHVVSSYTIEPLVDKDRLPPIGKPIDNCKLYIVGANSKLCPIGVPGEIWIGGVQVARGYLHRDELTQEKFITDPFTDGTGSRIYRTGDLGRWLEDGNIEYLGRIDDQVKIRGYRIELGEVEVCIDQSGMVLQNVVVAKADTQGVKRLIAYVVLKQGHTCEGIGQYLKEKLPEYMIPQLWVELPELPLNANGKIDKKSLPEPDIEEQFKHKYVAPENATQQTLSEIWQELLGVKQVGIEDNFFELGGHSLLAMRVISMIRKQLDVELGVKELFSYPSISQLCTYLETQGANAVLPPIEVGSRPKRIPLSFSQERLWFIDKLEGSVQYHLPSVLRLKGRLDRKVLERSIRAVIDRHEVLRTVISEHEGQGYQIIQTSQGWNLGYSEISGRSKEQIEQQILQHIVKPFDLSKDYMLRAEVIKLNDDEHILIATFHHIASDGWSTSVMVKELVECYRAFSQAQEPELLRPEIQYADYAIWQRKYLQGEVLEKKLDYWKQKLSKVSPLELPTDKTRPAIQSIAGSTLSFSISNELTEKLEHLSKSEQTTMFMTILGAFKALLHRYSGQEDICIGTPIAGRQHKETESLIGFFVNTLAIRSEVQADQSFKELLEQIRTNTLEAYAHQEVPFEKVVEVTVKERDLSRSPLFQVMFVYQNTPEVPVLQLGELQLSSETFENTTTQFDLTCMISRQSEGIYATIHYCTDLYERSTIERLAEHFQNVLNDIAEHPHKRIGQLRLLSPQEEHTLLHTFNSGKAEYPKDKTIVDLFEDQVDSTPQAIAVKFEQTQISYKELNERSNRLAHYLRSKGVKEETLVPICMQRSLEMIVGIMGILKSGGAYVPIDPEYPQDRINFMLEDTGAKLVLTDTASQSKLQQKHLELVDITKALPKHEHTNNLTLNNLTSGNLAYIIYTSGSTGKPKGVMIEHGNVYSFIQWCRLEFDPESFELAYAVTSMCFDLSVFEMFYPLSIGKPLRILENALFIEKYLKKDTKVLLNTVPSVVEGLLREGTDLRPVSVINMAGEPIGNYVQQYVDSENSEVRNLYGPSEDTTYSTVFRLIKGKPVTIGKPIYNTQIRIVNKELNLLPIGIAGEICISGTGVARGYLHRDELTQEKFITDPFTDGTGSRIYRTGDLGRWLEDGNIEYLGRIDDQVKIRGYRIELGEVEVCIDQSGMVLQNVVVAKADTQGVKRLIAYVVLKQGHTCEGIGQYLKEKLPEYMIPQLWVELPELPLNANGKIDKKSLPEPDIEEQFKHKYVAPENATQQTLSEIWQELLGVKQVGIEDNFFELGGHSLLAMRVISMIRKQLDVELGVKELFSYPSISQLCTYLETQGANAVLPPIEVGSRPKRIPLSFSQERLWFIDKLEGSVQYHLPSVLRLKGRLDRKVLERSIRAVIDRHEVLRTVISEHEGQGYQIIQTSQGWNLGYSEISGRSKEQMEQQILQHIVKPFDLSKDYMLRAEVIKLNDDEHILIATFHHIASDGWSTSVMVKELVECYRAFSQAQEPELLRPEIQYADYAIWQRKYLQGEVLEKKLDYWKQKLSKVSPLELPTDKTRPAIQSIAGSTLSFSISNELTEKLEHLSKSEQTTMFMTILGAFKALLHRYSGQEDICIGTPIAGRQHKETESLIGFFVNTLAIRSEVQAEQSFKELLEQIRTNTLEAYAHQEVPFEKVVEVTVKERDLSRSPLFQVMFVYQNTPEVPVLQLGELQLSSETFENTTTQFDLTCMISRQSEGIYATIHYCTDLYERSTIERLAEHFQNVLNDIAEHPHKRIGQLRLLSPQEEHTLLHTFNSGKAEYPKDKTIVDLFEDQVDSTPQAIAVKFEQTQISYKELNERSNRLAHYLRSKGVKEETLVPICMQRSLEMIVGIMGILKSGGAYVPIDPEYPQDRINFMLEDTGAKLVLTDTASQSKLQQKHLELVDISKALPNDLSSNNLTSKDLTSGNLAYIIYTSGSTGKPKGVMIEHGSVVNLILAQSEYFHITPADKIVQVANYSFDASVEQIFLALSNGAKLVLFKEGLQLDLFQFSSFLKGECITHLHATPAFLTNLRHLHLPDLKRVIAGGDVCNWELRDQWDTTHEFYNEYGPTETTVTAIEYFDTQNKRHRKSAMPIGKGLANIDVYILDKHMNLCPVGVPGELCLGGVQVARGYLNRDELTAEKFIKNTYQTDSNARIYRTGDVGRWLDDGNIEYLGRIDEQVKIRGYRIELGEIEVSIQQSGMASKNVVIAKADSQGLKRLIAYVVLKHGMTFEGIQNYLKEKLPEYMIPQLWVEVPELPLNANGKIDKKALPDPEMDQKKQTFIAPQNPMQQTLVEIWQGLLDIKQVGIEDNFFELGGHSLLAMRVISEIRTKLTTEINILELFNNPTVKSLSELLVNRQETDLLPPILKQENVPEFIPLSSAQERIWYIDKLEGSLHYHINSVLRIEGNVDIKALETAFKNVIERHEVLRTVFLQHDDEVYQKVISAEQWELEFDGNTINNIEYEIQKLINKPFDLSRDYVLRASVLSSGKDEYLLILVVHHIASDGWSTTILVNEVIENYTAISQGKSKKTKPLPLQYSDVALWQRKYLQGEFLEKKLQYWKNQLSDSEPLDLPIDKKRPGILTTHGASLSFSLDKASTQRISDYSNAQGSTLFMNLLAVFKLILHKYSNQKNICIGIPIAGRFQKETEVLIGNFINTLAINTEINPGESFARFLTEVKQITLDAYTHQEVPIEKVIEAVVHDRDLSRSPLFQVLFVFQNTPELPELKLGEASLIPVATKHSQAKFELTLNISQLEDGLNGEFIYNTDLFEQKTIERLKDHFVGVLNNFVNYLDKPVAEIELIDSQQKTLLLEQGSSSLSNAPKQTVLEMLQEQTLQHPDRIALVSEGESLSYAELDKRSNQIAGALIAKGVRPGSAVLLYLEQAIDRIAGIVGILKSGGCYVPIDTDFPASRIEYILSDTGAGHILSTGSLIKTLEPTTAAFIDIEKLTEEPDNYPKVAIPSQSPAYVIYTSGSTGKPKGVVVSHGNLTDYVYGLDDRIQISQCTSYALVSSIATDLGNTVLYGSLVYGGTLHLFSKEAVRSAEYLQDYFKHTAIDCLKIVPSHWKALSEQRPLLPKKLLIFGGESLPGQTLTMINQTQSSCRVINHYGPTETTIGKLLHEADKNRTYGTSVPIGTPFGNTRVYVLSPWKQLCPVGVPGELYIGGAGLSQGYWNNEQLTQEKFIVNPIEPTPQRLYATGDRVKYLEDGNIEYLGRIDDQVKIRGYRVEPMEIERMLDKSGLLQMAAIEVKQDSNGNKYLVAYVVAGTNYSKEKLGNYLKQNLPEYMIPGQTVEMESFPMLPNGKINRKGLPEVDLAGMIEKNYIPPSTPTEQVLVELWQELLELDKIGINDNFFELGGHSLKAFRVISGVRRELDLELELVDLVKHPTIRELAEILDFQRENPDAIRNDDD